MPKTIFRAELSGGKGHKRKEGWDRQRRFEKEKVRAEKRVLAFNNSVREIAGELIKKAVEEFSTPLPNTLVNHLGASRRMSSVQDYNAMVNYAGKMVGVDRLVRILTKTSVLEKKTLSELDGFLLNVPDQNLVRKIVLRAEDEFEKMLVSGGIIKIKPKK